MSSTYDTDDPGDFSVVRPAAAGTTRSPSAQPDRRSPTPADDAGLVLDLPDWDLLPPTEFLRRHRDPR